MIRNNINQAWRIRLARTGDTGVFGEESDVRRKMESDIADKHFTQVWKEVLEPEIRTAERISHEQAAELLEGKQREYAIKGFQFRQFSIRTAVFVARLDLGATDDGVCDQLWPLGAFRDNTRLCMYFELIEYREYFAALSKQLGYEEPWHLAMDLAMDFMRKFPAFETVQKEANAKKAAKPRQENTARPSAATK